jgi:hypothetical protein
MLTVVFYDPATGTILSCAQISARNAEASETPFLVVDEFHTDYDVTHRVEGGRLVEVMS